MRISPKIRQLCIALAVLSVIAIACIFVSLRKEPSIPVSQFFAYNPEVPLNPEIALQFEDESYSVSHVIFSSVHRARVPGLLYLPQAAPGRRPAILYQHGAGNSKEGDDILQGLDLFARNGFVAMAIDAEFHGERTVEGYDMDAETFLGVPHVELRDALVQTCVDLRRAVDFLCQLPEVDPNRIGYVGISMGGILGATFAGLDERVQVCVLAVAGGGFSKMAQFANVPAETQRMAIILEPLNFVARISPRRIHMINAENDEIIPKISAQLLYARARRPKSISWYPSGHVLPLADALAEANALFLQYL